MTKAKQQLLERIVKPNEPKFIHFMYCPWTGLGMYGGFRGNRWLKNRIKVFKQFVVPSLQNQSDKNFVLWCSWRREEKKNRHVQELMEYLANISEFKTVHTFHGVCFWDDKYPDEVAHERLLVALHDSMGELLDPIGDAENVYMTIQPSDDCYHGQAVHAIHECFKKLPEYQALGYSQGYMMNYRTKELAEYNPSTNPPFFTIKFPKDIFIDPLKHAEYTGPYKSHEYVGDRLKYGSIPVRGFLVGTHGENISTVFNHPYRGRIIEKGPENDKILKEFGLVNIPAVHINLSLRKLILRKLPQRVQRKLRYLFGEKFYNRLYNFLRS